MLYLIIKMVQLMYLCITYMLEKIFCCPVGDNTVELGGLTNKGRTWATFRGCALAFILLLLKSLPPKGKNPPLLTIVIPVRGKEYKYLMYMS